MIPDKRKSIKNSMRSLHRDIGFFVIGLTMVYCISGIILIYRDTDFLKADTLIERTVAPDLEESELAGALRLRSIEVIKNDDETIQFQNGTYNKATGTVKYTVKELSPLLSVFNSLHKASSGNPVHWLTTLFAVLLLFLAVSSFWMYGTGTKKFRRALYLTGSGILVTILMLLIL